MNNLDFIQYESTLKASGKTYKKIVFWNRFLRNPTETILTFIPAILSIISMCFGNFSIFTIIIYVICFAYPIYIFAYQFNSTVNYHLKHRDPAEEAACTMTVNKAAITADIPDFELNYVYEWDDFTTAYYKYGYYMFFNKGKMIVMLKKSDMSEKEQAGADTYIKSCINQNKCKVLF